MNLLQLRFLDRALYRDLGLLFARIAGATLMLHGIFKLSHLSGTAEGFANLPMTSAAPTAFAAFTGVTQLLIGVLMLLGLFTRLAGLVGAGMFLYIIFLVNIPHGGFISPKTGGIAFEPALLFFTISVLVLFAGAGRFSLDHRLGSRVIEA